MNIIEKVQRYRNNKRIKLIKILLYNECYLPYDRHVKEFALYHSILHK